jgi:hypothetical protein
MAATTGSLVSMAKDCRATRRLAAGEPYGGTRVIFSQRCQQPQEPLSCRAQMRRPQTGSATSLWLYWPSTGAVGPRFPRERGTESYRSSLRLARQGADRVIVIEPAVPLPIFWGEPEPAALQSCVSPPGNDCDCRQGDKIGAEGPAATELASRVLHRRRTAKPCGPGTRAARPLTRASRCMGFRC